MNAEEDHDLDPDRVDTAANALGLLVFITAVVVGGGLMLLALAMRSFEY